MSIYTDYLNNHPDIDYKDFLKICAWSAKQLAPYKPQELEIIPEAFPSKAEEMKQQLSDLTDELQVLQNMSFDEQTSLRDEAFNVTEDEHWNKINQLEYLITVYGTILSDICRWNPENAEAKALKAFAVKELTANMPNLSKYSVSPVEPTVSNYINTQINTYKTSINALEKQIEEEIKKHNDATAYIALLNKELSLDEIVEDKEQEPSEINI